MMADWILVPCLVSLRAEFNLLAPARDKASDGSIGDVAHQQEASDHNPDETGRTPTSDADHINEVHAIDVDDDLRKTGWTMQRCCDIIRLRHQAGRDDRLQNIIYDRRICSRSWGWTWRAYTGASPHTEHAHFSARYTTAQENDTRPWGLLEEDDDMTFTETQMRAFPWQYVGGGIPAGMSTLGVLNELITSARAQKLRDEAILAAVRDNADRDAILARVDARAAELAAGIANVDEAIWSKADVTAAEKARLLRPLLGDDAAAVGALLAQSA